MSDARFHVTEFRGFDPCLSCSTHAAGQMPLHIQLFGTDGNIVNEVWRD
ncbi:hypothetical protein [Nostoc sp. LEGE 12450]|nr:hypothetical protein [Nostoc sp. LEGE 12450]MBE8986999.1 hypothetical protein [Nostoc sp. LEGE 12450]